MQDNQRQAVLIAYLAGIIDGEGCISLRRNKGRGQYYVRVCVGIAHRRTCELLQETFGGNVRQEKRSKYPNAQPIFRWDMSRTEDVLNFLEQVAPFIRIKARQVKLAYEWIELKKRNISLGPVKLSDAEIQRREDMYQKMREFNAVGAAATTNWEDIREDEVIV